MESKKFYFHQARLRPRLSDLHWHLSEIKLFDGCGWQKQ